jgi:hypothetical protein
MREVVGLVVRVEKVIRPYVEARREWDARYADLAHTLACGNALVIGAPEFM